MNMRSIFSLFFQRRWEILLLVCGWGVYFVIKYAGPFGVAYLFSEKSFDLLNWLAVTQGQQSLDFYLGRVQETLLGPAIQTLSFSLLALIVCRYFQNASLRVFALIIFIFLLITKFEVLLFPPYGDAIGGPFAEALWLYQHGFDYVGLFKEPNFTVGGPRVYFFSIYPGFLAATLKTFPWVKVFLGFHHILTFALTAGIIAMLRAYGLCRKAFDPVLAALVSLILLALPLFQSQSEAINMEIPVTFFSLWSAYLLISKRWWQSAVIASVAAMVKGTGVIACMAVFIVLCVMTLRMHSFREKLNFFGLAMGSAFMGVFIVSAKFLFRDAHVQQGLVQLDAGWPSLKKEFIFFLFLIAAIVSLIYGISGYVRKFKKDIMSPSIMFLFAAGWFLLFLNFYAVSPRYRVTLYPFLIFIVAYAVTLILKWKIFVRVMAIGVLMAACLFSYGSFYGSVPENDHVLLERSLEYRNDLELNRRLVRAAEERYSDRLIVAPFTIAQALAIPELGYVHKKLKVMIYGFGIKYGNIANYPGLKYLNLMKTVFVGVTVAPITPGFLYPVGPQDLVLEKLSVGNKTASFFMGGYAIETLWRVTHGLNQAK